MRRQVNNIISVIISAFRVLLYKLIRGKDFQSNLIERISPNVVLEFNKGSKVTLGKKVRIHSGSKIKVRPNGKLTIGNNVKINYYCIIACHDEITIGEGTKFGPSVYVYDHDHKKGLCEKSEDENFITGKIKIGKNCWIGAHTVILRGTTIGDNCIVGAGSIVSGTVPSGSLFVQKKEKTIIEG